MPVFSNKAVAVTFYTALITTLLAILKLVIGAWGQSHALIADGVHSLSDVFIDILVLFAAHYGKQKADVNHPYGHGRIETAATFGLALILILAGIGIIIDAGRNIWDQSQFHTPNLYVLWVAIISIVVNEALFRYNLSVSKKIHSSLLEANAWHSRSDVAVSIVVLLSIVGALLGFHYLDAIGAIIVGAMIIKMGIGLAWKSISELIDTGVDVKTIHKIQSIIKSVPGINTLHMLRTRTINNKIVLDVHLLVDPHISVSEGHYIGEQVIRTLFDKVDDVSDVTVHIDPEDDEVFHTSVTLPNRKNISAMLQDSWQYLPGYTQISEIRLHYLGGKIEVEIYMPLNFIQSHHNTFESLLTTYQDAISHINCIRCIKIWVG